MNKKLAAFADEADGQIDGQIKAMVENGISYLEIRGVDGQNIADISISKAKEVLSKLNDNGLKVWSLGSPFGKIGINDDFESHLDKFKKGSRCPEFDCKFEANLGWLCPRCQDEVRSHGGPLTIVEEPSEEQIQATLEN